MRIAFFSAKNFEKIVFDRNNLKSKHSLHYIESHLSSRTAVLAEGFEAVCAFVTDCLDAETLETLARGKCRVIALRSAGFNHVDLAAAKKLNLKVVRVPSYSPNAIAEHTVGLMLSLNRKIHKAYNRVREGNFSLEGLTGFDFSSRCIGVVGTGNIGAIVARIMLGFGSRVVAFDPQPRDELKAWGVKYLELSDLLSVADVITLHCPLTPQSRHLINASSLEKMKDGVMLINTGRGALIDTKAVVTSLKSGKIGYLGLDVYEEEEGIFFEDGSNQVMDDDVLARLIGFPNVLITGHQAFLTQEALKAIAQTTLENIDAFEQGKLLRNEVTI